MTTRKQIERRWGLPFDDLVRDFAEHGLTRKQTAQALGMTAPALSHLLINNDPFPPLCRAVDYLRDTGETLATGIRRMAPSCTVGQVAAEVGFSCPYTLRRWMRENGVSADFAPGRYHARA